MQSRVVHAVAVASAVLITTASGSSFSDDIAPLAIDVGSHQAVFVGNVAASVTRPADRLEIVLAERAQPDGAADARVTAALLVLAHNVLPHATVRPLATAVASSSVRRMLGYKLVPRVRIRLSMPASNFVVQDSVNRLLAAINSRGFSYDVSGARIISIDHIYARCAPADTLLRNAAQTRVEQLARALGTPSNSRVTLQPVPHGLFEAPPEGTPSCTGGSAIFPAAVLPSSASYRFRQGFTFAQTIRFAVAAPTPRRHEVWTLWSGPMDGPRLKLHGSAALLTVERNAVLERRPTGTLYIYDGPNYDDPNRRWHLQDITLEALAAIRRRLRAAGVADSDIATQLSPNDGRWNVRVHSPDIRWNDAIAAAIGGNFETERQAVKTTAFGDTCSDEQHALARAVADAQAHARRIAAGLGASIESAPVAVRIAGAIGFTACTVRGMEYTPPARMPQHISGQLQLGEFESDRRVDASVTFRIGHPRLTGLVRSDVASDNPTSLTAHFGYAAPPIDYPDAAHQGDAQLEVKLRSQRIQVDSMISPDNRDRFAAIDPGLAARLAATLGASAAKYTAAFVADFNRDIGRPDAMLFQAELQNRGSATEHALNTALVLLQAAGYGGFSIVPESDGCAAADDALALDAIRAAAHKMTSSEQSRRLIAIDLRGPFAVEGRCGSIESGVPTWAIREATIKDVRLASYARVSFGR